MKTLTLNESHAPYRVALDDAPLSGEVVILEKDGHPVAAVVPIHEYTAFQAWREAEERRQLLRSEETQIELEHKAFLQMLPELLKQYQGRVVAIHRGQVVAVGDERMEVWQRARRQLAGVPIYVQTVEYPPAVYKMPHRKVVADVDL
jgi:hypothetical protein